MLIFLSHTTLNEISHWHWDSTLRLLNWDNVTHWVNVWKTVSKSCVYSWVLNSARHCAMQVTQASYNTAHWAFIPTTWGQEFIPPSLCYQPRIQVTELESGRVKIYSQLTNSRIGAVKCQSTTKIAKCSKCKDLVFFLTIQSDWGFSQIQNRSELAALPPECFAKW